MAVLSPEVEMHGVGEKLKGHKIKLSRCKHIGVFKDGRGREPQRDDKAWTFFARQVGSGLFCFPCCNTIFGNGVLNVKWGHGRNNINSISIFRNGVLQG